MLLKISKKDKCYIFKLSNVIKISVIILFRQRIALQNAKKICFLRKQSAFEGSISRPTTPHQGSQSVSFDTSISIDVALSGEDINLQQLLVRRFEY